MGYHQPMLNPPRLAFVDVETDGIGAEARVIEIAVIANEADSKSTRSFRSFVKGSGKAGPTWVHGIKDQDLKDAPSFKDVWPQISELVEGRIIVAHNESFDRSRLNFELQKIGIEPLSNFLCTMKLAYQLGYAKRKKRGEEGVSAKLSELSQRLGIATKLQHRALEDSQTCLEVFEFFYERHRDQVSHELSLINPIFGGKKIAVDSRKPLIVIVDSANISERRRGKKWEFEAASGKLQYWSFEHFTDFRDNLRATLPGAAILCFFDEKSKERCSSIDDEANLLYAWARAPHEEMKIFKVPLKFSADDLIFDLAKKLNAYVISGDRFEEQEDSAEWTRKEMLFYPQYPLNTQRWKFVNQFDEDKKIEDSMTLATSTSMSNLREITESEFIQLTQYVEKYSFKFFGDKKNVRGERLKQRYQAAPLTSGIIIGDIQLTEVSDVRRIAKANIRAYHIPFLRKYLKEYVTIVGRLSRSGSAIYIEWFNGYRPIEVIPEDDSLFSEHIGSHQFVEVSGKMRDSSGRLVIEAARIEKITSFDELRRKMPITENRMSALPRFRANWVMSKTKSVREQLEEVKICEPVVSVREKIDLLNQVEHYGDIDLPNPVERFSLRKSHFVCGIVVLVIVALLSVWFGDSLLLLFGFNDVSSQILLGPSSNRLTIR